MASDFVFGPMPHERAREILAGKPAVTREVYDQLLPELRGRAFTMTGVEDANALQSMRDTLQGLPEGEPWDAVQGRLLEEMSPWFDGEQALIRANLLMRHNGFQAYMTAKHEVMVRQQDAFPYWQYISMEDAAVRDSHAALNGLILPADSPFWDTHTPPWDWGCRCELVPLTQAEAAEIEGNADFESRGTTGSQGWVPGPAERRAIETANEVNLGPARRVDVTPPREREGRNRGSFAWHPGDMRIGLNELRERYDATVFGVFEQYARSTTIDEDGRTLWQWLDSAPGGGA